LKVFYQRLMVVLQKGHLRYEVDFEDSLELLELIAAVEAHSSVVVLWYQNTQILQLVLQ
jgi:hypothetical protein